MKLHQIAVQLYTLRQLCTSHDATVAVLREIKSIGYAAVEIAGLCPLRAEEIRLMCEDAGLGIVAHNDGSVIREPEKVVEFLCELGITRAVYPSPAGFNLGKKSDVERMAEGLSTAGKILRDAGKKLCYHHHSAEFTPLEGTTVLDWLLAKIPADLMALELDTYWVQHGGASHVEYLRRYAGRIPILHCKDFGNILGTPTIMEVGRGNLNWKEIIPEADAAGIEWFVVEQDTCPRGPLPSIATSYETLAALAQ